MMVMVLRDQLSQVGRWIRNLEELIITYIVCRIFFIIWQKCFTDKADPIFTFTYVKTDSGKYYPPVDSYYQFYSRENYSIITESYVKIDDSRIKQICKIDLIHKIEIIKKDYSKHWLTPFGDLSNKKKEIWTKIY